MEGPSSKRMMLEQIKEGVPELQIDMDLAYMNWKENCMMKNRPEDIDLSKLAAMITSTKYLHELQEYFGGCPDRYLGLLLEKIKVFKEQDNELRRRTEICTLRSSIDNDENYFEREEKKMFDQNRYALELEIMKYEDLINQFLRETINSDKVEVSPYEQPISVLYFSTQDSQSEEREIRRKRLERVIKLVAAECGDDIIANC